MPGEQDTSGVEDPREDSPSGAGRSSALQVAVAIVILCVFAGLGLFLYVKTQAHRDGYAGSQFGAWFNLLSSSARQITAVEPAPFITDAHGHWVANPSAIGINSAGFRSPEFDEPAGGRPTVVFAGASFTWGYSAQPLGASYVDLVREKGFKAINLGIPASQPTYIADIAEDYIPQIQPDVVFLMLESDDRIDFAVELQPGHPLYHITTQSWLSGYGDDQQPLSLPEAYQYSLNLLNRPRKAPTLEEQRAITRAAFQRVAQVCDSLGIPHHIVFVPPNPRAAFASKIEEHAAGLEDLGILRAPGIQASHYTGHEDVHFNNAGHAYFAEFLSATLIDLGHVPNRDYPVRKYPYLDAGQVEFGEFSKHFGLDAAQEAGAREILNAFQEAVFALYQKPGSDGAPGPLVAFGEALASGETGLYSVEQLVTYSVGRTEAESGKPYEALLGAAESEARARLSSLLRPSQEYWLVVFPTSLVHVTADHDPLGRYVLAKAASSEPSDDAGDGAAGNVQRGANTLDRLASLLSLTPEQRASARVLVDELKRARMALLRSAPEEGAVPPLEVFAQRLDEDATTAGPALMEYLAATREAASGKTYLELVESQETEALRALGEILDETQKLRFVALRWPSLFYMETGFDPLGEYMQSRATARASAEAAEGQPSLQQMTALLGLNAEEAERVRAHLNALKDARAALMTTPAEGGGASPVSMLSSLIASGAADAGTAFSRYTEEHRPAGASESYAALMVKQEQSAAAGLAEILTPPQMGAFMELQWPSLSDIHTGHDPVGAAIAAAEQSE